MSLMSSTSPSVFIVLSLGGFSGGVVKGVTGFGNAIINLLVWVAFTAGGVNSGPLQLAVLADSFSCVVCSIPLLVMTSAHKTADWKLVVTILAFTSAGAPLGAALLTHLAVRWVELAMGCVLLLVICLHVKLLETARDTLRRWCANHRSVSASHNVLPSNATLGGEDVAIVCPDARLCCEDLAALTIPTASVGAAGTQFQDSQASAICARPAGERGAPAATIMGDPKGDTSLVPAARFHTHNCCCIAEYAQVTTSPTQRAQSDGVVPQPGQRQDCRHADGETGVIVGQVGASTTDTEPLLEPGTFTSDAALPLGATQHPNWAGGAASKCCLADGSVSTKELVGAGLRRWLQRQDWKEIRRIVFFGSLAGFASGIMGGMTGIGGPPLMFMYEKLKVAKDVVRGTNAVINVLQVRLVSYVIMGVFKRGDITIYAVTSVMGLGGVVLGNSLAGRLDQRGFSRVLNVLMVICCLLLFASAAGFKGHAA
ncbi:hypothetical protein Vretimale_5521 [Volvox reticuliferus]|uniref:Uncharacterized protein n=1 Tax=Volvox reticuliferus TaxID=1737510 RepID=A0A8J4C829_9CHLO|nr:hypothetical protein Vretifemale_5522 [Volvox reticuliferus]GIM00526.1 hypothetical protein Vretimale_5521 [Volvox reticuliferus]